MLTIADKTFTSRLFLGTGKFSSSSLMAAATKASGSELVTVALKRVELSASTADDMIAPLLKQNLNLLPNTSGARTAEEAILAAELSREALQTNWLKLEIHPDPRYLMPDPIETLKAAEALVKRGFVVLPYVQADPVLCKRLEEVGCATVMPLAAPIGSNPARYVAHHHSRKEHSRGGRCRIGKSQSRSGVHGNGSRRCVGEYRHSRGA